MIRITDFEGRAHYVAAQAVARVTEAGASSQWHGIRAVVRLFDGTVIEARDEAKGLAEKVAAGLAES